jgi:hypothetical protein
MTILAGGPATTTPAVTAESRPTRAPRRSRKAPVAGLFVACMFCRERIEIASFVVGAPDPRLMSASCSNCGLMVSVTPSTLASWSTSDVVADRDRDSELARRMRARRVAQGTRAILRGVRTNGPRDERVG